MWVDIVEAKRLQGGCSPYWFWFVDYTDTKTGATLKVTTEASLVGDLV